MIWRWLICSSVGLGVAFGALVTGEVELTNSKNLAVRKHKDYEGVVLWLEPVDRPVPALAPRKVEMQQKDKQFQPHVLAISLGSTVELPNLDLIWRLREAQLAPICAYHVSSEFSSVKAADRLGWLDGDQLMFQHLLAIRRAGADMIVTYAGREAVEKGWIS